MAELNLVEVNCVRRFRGRSEDTDLGDLLDHATVRTMEINIADADVLYEGRDYTVSTDIKIFKLSSPIHTIYGDYQHLLCDTALNGQNYYSLIDEGCYRKLTEWLAINAPEGAEEDGRDDED